MPGCPAVQQKEAPLVTVPLHLPPRLAPVAPGPAPVALRPAPVAPGPAPVTAQMPQAPLPPVPALQPSQAPMASQAPAPVWQAVQSTITDVGGISTTEPTMKVLIRDFEMQNEDLPVDWESKMSCCGRCAQHITSVLSELAEGTQILIPLEPSGPSVPVPRTGREGPFWYQAYEGYQELVVEALSRSNADSVHRFFQDSSCAMHGLLTWRLGEVQGFLRLCFTALGLPAPKCHPAVWYQLIREVTDDLAARINEEQSLQLLRLVLQRVHIAGPRQDEGQTALPGHRVENLCGVATVSSKAPSPAPSTRTPGSAERGDAQMPADAEASPAAQLRPSAPSPYRIAWHESAPTERPGAPQWRGAVKSDAGGSLPRYDSLPAAPSSISAQLHQSETVEPCPAFLNTKELVESAQMAEQMDSLPEMNISFGALADAVSMTAGASNEMCTGRSATTTEATKLPEEKEVCQLLEAVQTAFLDLAQRLGSQRAIWKGEGKEGNEVLLGDMQWFDLSAPAGLPMPQTSMQVDEQSYPASSHANEGDEHQRLCSM